MDRTLTMWRAMILLIALSFISSCTNRDYYKDHATGLNHDKDNCSGSEFGKERLPNHLSPQPAFGRVLIGNDGQVIGALFLGKNGDYVETCAEPSLFINNYQAQRVQRGL